MNFIFSEPEGPAWTDKFPAFASAYQNIPISRADQCDLAAQ